jgi:protein-L-isoaspartate(D-aspartate) O-methyltransferase
MKFLAAIFLFILGNMALFQGDKFSEPRNKMVSEQIIKRGISDKKTIAALRKVPRHLFVPENLKDEAYKDSPLPIGYGQTISQPFIVALMTQVSLPDKGKRVLEIGTGSGYQAAVLAEIVDTVYTIEIVPELALEAAAKFKKLGYGNIVSKYGDGYIGWPQHAPFDIIIVTAAPEKIPEPLKMQLAENGRMIIPVGGQYAFQDLILLEKKKGRITEQRITSVRFVPFNRL